jgi:TonB family protein
MARVFGIVSAVLLHVGFLLFGGLIFGREDQAAALAEVELVGEPEPVTDDEEPETAAPESDAELETEVETPPDASQIVHALELSAAAAAPALEAASLAAIEQALGGGSAAGEFGNALSFASGGRIGGLGGASAVEQVMDRAFSLAEIDQKPRAVLQTAPLYPSQMRGKKVEGLVTLIFVVDASGKVINPRVEESSHPAFAQPALDAVEQWRFEPAVRGGERVSCRMRVPIRFQAH